MSNINVMRKNLGPVTAYKYAVSQGYTGTEQEFAALMASYATVAETATQAADDAVDAKTAAEAAQAAAEAAAEQAEGAIEIDDTLSVEGRAADAKKTGNKITGLKEDLNDISGAFNTTENLLPLSAFVSGKYINKDGVEGTISNIEYAYATITDDLVDKTILVSGSAWYGSIKPFVFVDSNSNVTYADVENPESTSTQYTDIVFKPVTTGTLYLNRYISGNVAQKAKAYYTKLSALNSSYISVDKDIKGIMLFNPVTLALTQGKLLNADSGAISDSDSTTYRVSDYIEIDPSSKVAITTEHFWSQGMWAFYDENYTFISGKKANAGGTVTQSYCEVVNTPSNAKYIVIGFLYQSAFPEPFLFKGVIQPILPSRIWNNYKWACIGDSLTESYGVTSVHYFEFINWATGINTVNLGASGCGYAKGTNNFMTKGLLVPSDSDVVTIFGSGNDASSGLELGTASDTGTSTIAGCINTAIDNVFSINPIIPIGIITPTPWQNNMPSNNGWMENYANLIVEICKKRSLPCLDLFHCSNLNPNSSAVRNAAYSKDNGGVHPNEAGHKIIATHVKAFLQTLLL